MKTTVSTKHQIVIPKSIRRQLAIVPGQTLSVTVNKKHEIVIRQSTTNFLDAYTGVIDHKTTAWGKQNLDATEWIRKQRNAEWQ